MEASDIAEFQNCSPLLASILHAEALHATPDGGIIGVPQFPSVFRHLLWHLFQVSVCACNPRRASEVIQDIRHAWSLFRPFDEVAPILDLLEAPVDTHFVYDPESLRAYTENQLRLVDSPLWKEVLTGIPRFPEVEDHRGRTTKDADKCEGPQPVNAGRKRKYPIYKRGWTKGLLVVACPHRFIYMTAVLMDHESVRDFACALYTRIPREDLPDVFVYDNACKLREWVLRREHLAHHFSGVKFVVDSFHMGSIARTVHNCGEHLRPVRDSLAWKLYGANTAAVESINAWLRRMENSVRNMSLPRFIRHVACLCDLWNETLLYA